MIFNSRLTPHLYGRHGISFLKIFKSNQASISLRIDSQSRSVYFVLLHISKIHNTYIKYTKYISEIISYLLQNFQCEQYNFLSTLRRFFYETPFCWFLFLVIPSGNMIIWQNTSMEPHFMYYLFIYFILVCIPLCCLLSVDFL